MAEAAFYEGNKYFHNISFIFYYAYIYEFFICNTDSCSLMFNIMEGTWTGLKILTQDAFKILSLFTPDFKHVAAFHRIIE